MKGAKRLTASSYEIGDIINVYQDDHVFGSKDLNANRVDVALGELTEAEINRLKMKDEAPVNVSAISKLPTFRSISTSEKNLTMLRRRKYQFDNGVKLKANAQERS